MMRLCPLPEPGEARAIADELRDMMASGAVDQRLCRRAANALDQFADGAFEALLDAPVTGDPFGVPTGSFDPNQPVREGTAS